MQIQIHPTRRRQFNHKKIVDIFYIHKKAVLQVVDELIRYEAVRLLSDLSAETIWRALRVSWIDVYLRSPNVITHDARKQIISRAFQVSVDVPHIETKVVPIEASYSMSIVERYHAPFPKAFRILKEEAIDINDDDVAKIAVK